MQHQLSVCQILNPLQNLADIHRSLHGVKINNFLSSRKANPLRWPPPPPRFIPLTPRDRPPQGAGSSTGTAATCQKGSVAGGLLLLSRSTFALHGNQRVVDRTQGLGAAAAASLLSFFQALSSRSLSGGLLAQPAGGVT